MNQPPLREVSPAWADLVRKVATHDELIAFIRTVARGGTEPAELEQSATALLNRYDKGAT